MYLDDYELVAIPNMNRDLPFIEDLKGLFKFMCWIYGVPDSIFAQESSNRAVQTESKGQYANSCIRPLLVNRQSCYNEDYLPKFYPPKYEVDDGLFYVFNDPVPVNADSLIKQTGGVAILTPNEARELINRDAMEGGESLYIPSGMIQMGIDSAEQGKAFADSVMKQMAEMEKGEM